MHGNLAAWYRVWRWNRRSGQALTRILFLAITFFLLLSEASESQRFPARNYTEQDGLRSSTVYALAQDRGGRMWFLTRAGVQSYDGFEWSLPPTDGVPPFGQWRFLETDGAGAWVASVDGGRPLLHLDPRGEVAGRLPPPRPGADVTGFVVPRKSGPAVVVGTRRHGLRFWQRDRWNSASLPDGRTRFPVFTLESDGERTFIGTDLGAFELRDGRLESVWNGPNPWGDTEVRALAWDSRAGRERLWLVGSDRVAVLEEERVRIVVDSVSIPFNRREELLLAEPDRRSYRTVGDVVHPSIVVTESDQVGGRG